MLERVLQAWLNGVAPTSFQQTKLSDFYPNLIELSLNDTSLKFIQAKKAIMLPTTFLNTNFLQKLRQLNNFRTLPLFSKRKKRASPKLTAYKHFKKKKREHWKTIL